VAIVAALAGAAAVVGAELVSGLSATSPVARPANEP
jgi:hypothetical protein